LTRIRLDRHPDGGCWISDDRVNAFVSAEARGVAEIGFHGNQPVSRHSRLLARPEGVLSVSIRCGGETPFSCAEVEWDPGSIRTTERAGDAVFVLTVQADGRCVRIRAEAPEPAGAEIVVRFSPRAMYTAVQGERTWSAPRLAGQYVELACRDVIMLSPWLRRTGPYAGDFLIPESLRRKIFARRCRSGLATYDDLLPEYREAPIALYDAKTFLRLGGEQFTVALDQGGYLFTAAPGDERGFACEFVVACADDPAHFSLPEDPALPRAAAESPRLSLPGFESTSRFFAAVPGVVRSATLRRSGMPRASAGAYYWVWAWDAMVTALEMPLWGDSAGAARIARFVDGHRDEGEAIPARWTRALEPLDTPSRGGLDFLLFLLALRCAGEGEELPPGAYDSAARWLENASLAADERGLIAGLGFYPDLPVAFGRTERSAVAMETGALYAFCRLLESTAVQRGDARCAQNAAELGGRIQRAFAPAYFDARAGFLVDAVDTDGRSGNETYPLFTLMFLQTPLGVRLLRPHTAAAAAFARRHLQDRFGTRLVPASDTRARSEDALSSWYPHWDIYLVKLFRRGKVREGILAWLGSVERLLDRLGYAPEFIRMEGLAGEDAEGWRRHGAVSNLNCATGWYRALIEGLFGVEFDTGGMAVVPLDIDMPPVRLEGVRYRGSAWTISVRQEGGGTPELMIDGTRLTGCTKIPRGFYDGGAHRLDVAYTGAAPAPLFTEIVNAEVIAAEGDACGAHATVHGFGTVDVAFEGFTGAALSVDGARVPYLTEPGTGTCYAQVQLTGTHTIALAQGGENS